jgi:DNA-binding HxlR family transcriptional regulator
MSLKIRRNHSPPPPEPCRLTECMAIIAGAWAPNVIWSLRAGPRRFSELRIDIPPVSAKVLSQRLKELESRGVLDRTVQTTTPPSVDYRLTDLGQHLIPALQAIVEVGHRLKTGSNGTIREAAGGNDREHLDSTGKSAEQNQR